jgi:hypothetical protein
LRSKLRRHDYFCPRKLFSEIFLVGRFLSYPTRHDLRATERQNMITMTTTADQTNEQLELGLNAGQRAARVARRENRMARATWWFNKMREVVNGTMDWPPTDAPRPEQTFLPGAYRQVRI